MTQKFTLHFTSIDYGINSILFQRGIYPAETFENHQQYGLTILMSTDTKIKEFLKTVLKQTEGMTSHFNEMHRKMDVYKC